MKIIKYDTYRSEGLKINQTDNMVRAVIDFTRNEWNEFKRSQNRKLFEQKIAKLEIGTTIPGTQLSRCLDDDGPAWCLALGKLSELKRFFYGKSIKEVLKKAEKASLNSNIVEQCGRHIEKSS